MQFHLPTADYTGRGPACQNDAHGPLAVLPAPSAPTVWADQMNDVWQPSPAVLYSPALAQASTAWCVSGRQGVFKVAMARCQTPIMCSGDPSRARVDRPWGRSWCARGDITVTLKSPERLKTHLDSLTTLCYNVGVGGASPAGVRDISQACRREDQSAHDRASRSMIGAWPRKVTVLPPELRLGGFLLPLEITLTTEEW